MSIEKPYEPSADEIRKAEEMMSEKERGRSESRREGFELGQIDERRSIEKKKKEAEPDKDFNYEASRREIEKRFEERHTRLIRAQEANKLGNSIAYSEKLRQAQGKKSTGKTLLPEDTLVLDLEEKYQEIINEKKGALAELEERKIAEEMKKLNQI